MKETKLLCMLMALLLSVLCAVPAQARWYGAEEGRFISVAPYTPDVEHPYVYCANDPVNQTDPTGELNIGGCIVGGACAAMLAWHANECKKACGNIWDTRQVCGDDGNWHTQVYDTGETDWGCVGKCILDGATSGWRGKVFSSVCGASIYACLSNLKVKPAIHGPHHRFPLIGKRPHVQVNWWRPGVKGSGGVIRIPY